MLVSFKAFWRPTQASAIQRRSTKGVLRNRFTPMLEALEDRSVLSTLTVVDLGDTGTGSGSEGDLRYAIITANSNTDASNSIVFEPGLTGTITLVLGKLSITKDLEIAGPGAAALTISGNHQSAVVELPDDPRVQHVQIADLTLSDGIGIPFISGHSGGGLFNDHATVTLTRVTVSGNSVGDGLGNAGGGIYNLFGTMVLNSCTVAQNHAAIGGGINNANGTMILNDSVVADNTAIDAAGIANQRSLTINHGVVSGNVADQVGGGIQNIELLTVSASTIVHNQSLGSGGGIANINGQLTLLNSVIANNSSPGHTGGGIFNIAGSMTLSASTIAGNSAIAGAGIYHGIGSLSLTNSTISGNTAELNGGGIFMAPGPVGIATFAELTSSTVTQNTANDTGGGLFVADTVRVLVRNTILAGNVAVTRGSDVHGAVMSLGFNLEGQVDDSTGWLRSDHTGTAVQPIDPRLGPLQDNGGPTPTHAVLVGSPAFRKGDPTLRYSTDQRGTLRSDFGFPDVGAFQAEPAQSFRIFAPAVVASGEAFEFTVVAIDLWGNTASTYTRRVGFTSSDAGAGLPGNYAFTVADAGQHTFTATLQAPGRQTITVTDTAAFLLSGSTVVEVMDNPAPSGRGVFWYWWARQMDAQRRLQPV